MKKIVISQFTAVLCQDNNPPPTGGNNIAKQKQGQCVNL